MKRSYFLFMFLSAALLMTLGCGTKKVLRGTLQGTVVDSQTGIGIAGATVTTTPATQTVTADINGRFTIYDVEPGVYTVLAYANDFNSNSYTVSVDGGMTANTNVVLVSTGGSFSRNVLPILSVNCSIIGCHNDASNASGLRLNSYENIMKGGRQGGVVYPYNASRSPLIQRIKGTVTPRMPHNRAALSTADQALLINWIEGGARDN
ncbi:MAG: hypothetical protein GX221_00620 [Candidatus Riflebacteria bacterium]|nr:hypothetical protein [Candidatus Riflebacteria bacterium]